MIYSNTSILNSEGSVAKNQATVNRLNLEEAIEDIRKWVEKKHFRTYDAIIALLRHLEATGNNLLLPREHLSGEAIEKTLSFSENMQRI